MPWYAWVVVGLIAASSAATILNVNKPREPTSPGVALAVLVVNGLIVWAVVVLGSAQ